MASDPRLGSNHGHPGVIATADCPHLQLAGNDRAPDDNMTLRPDCPATGVAVLGPVVDDQTRCVHYSGPTDVIAIKFKCCGTYYPCFECHRDTTDHPVLRWPTSEWDQPAILFFFFSS